MSCSPSKLLGYTQTELATVNPVDLPVKRYYRQRAHCNPWSDHTLDYPIRPDQFNWDGLYGGVQSDTPENVSSDSLVRYVDVGCGYGGLLFKLAVRFPSVRSLGLEIRLKVSDFVKEKITALRLNHPGLYYNIACLRTNAMKFLPNFFQKGQLHKLFFLYPDPHFKRMKHKWRIISPTLLDVYAFLLCPGGRLYTTTDVPELASWMANCLYNHPLFIPDCCVQLMPSHDGKSLELQQNCDLDVCFEHVLRTPDEFDRHINSDPVLQLFRECVTEESLKATREGRGTTLLVFQRRAYPPQ
ncbi:tRNA (guanine-N(7)-)-methyltransferase B [Paragonimus heterotremus]|uniref:tRNA (guanine-N(7)-)-methyltransferase n=1 Tax=Paragonimus heterotremus TaxID=100268 RepID=A0A8J4X0G8_9TREM|nr:tRNA (guanine-N(7)-)-methyltransferase B [Paragonimus heterotremus]